MFIVQLLRNMILDIVNGVLYSGDPVHKISFLSGISIAQGKAKILIFCAFRYPVSTIARYEGLFKFCFLLYNMGGCWNSLCAMLDDLRHQGLLRHDLTGRLVVANSCEELFSELLRHAER